MKPDHDIDDVLEAVRQDRPLRPDHRYRVRFALNGVSYLPLVLEDPVPLGRQILKTAGAMPIDNHSLFLITEEGDFEDVRPDEEVDLRDRRAHSFIAFSGDPLYRVKLNDSRIVWGLPKISEEVLRTLAGIGQDEAVFLEVRGGTDQQIDDGEDVDLTKPGVEAFITAPHKKTFHYFVDGVRYETEHQSLTGAQIKAKVENWNANHDLSLEGHGDQPDRTIDDDESVDLAPKKGVRRFSSVPKADFG